MPLKKTYGVSSKHCPGKQAWEPPGHTAACSVCRELCESPRGKVHVRREKLKNEDYSGLDDFPR